MWPENESATAATAGFSVVKTPVSRATATATAPTGDHLRLKVGFYRKTCPDAESIVGGFVRDAAEFNQHIPAIMLRLYFHHCFVQGCDGSILIDNGPISEKLAIGHQGVKGFDVIEDARC
ncbi:hypothetical protein L2E82_14957 [Cichorium intybus]|uniref:Uncharacterized protein n=1 Tax=Cichorium intybus TaxID=13427 RepID=A0ACB9F1J0_CICIN|nr:hypothetical protein L2E82_14957 [Cichorium intybus]